jgi:hypothetical protein
MYNRNMIHKTIHNVILPKIGFGTWSISGIDDYNAWMNE